MQTRNGTDSVYLEVTCADIPVLLRRIEQSGILIYDIKMIDDMTVGVCCKNENLQQIKRIIEKNGAVVKNESVRGFGDLLCRILLRPVILVGIVMLCALLLVLQTRVLFIRVEGNNCVPSNQIMEQAQLCGISFGAPRRLIRSEGVKNALLDAIPQLQWVGINTRGCVATIHVTEKSIPETEDTASGPGSIVATHDGIISSCTVLDGTAVCRVGDAVSAGQVLVSGYTDCGIAIKSVRANAEIIANTARDLTAISPHFQLTRQSEIRTETRYALRVGKKLINFFKDSGISDTTCVKMYDEVELTLPGDFRLPVSLITQRCVYYTLDNGNDQSAPSWLEDYCEDYLIRHMQAGQILGKRIDTQCTGDICLLNGNYLCTEIIGQFKSEEIIDHDGETD